MMPKFSFRFIHFLYFFLQLFTIISKAQIRSDAELFKIIKSKDSLLFDIGFNKCDISQFEKLTSEKFEFYHDKGGKMLSKKTFIENTKNGLCKFSSYQARRELLQGTMEIYPLKNKDTLYGVLQTGIHRFFEKNEGKEEVFGSIAKFTHIWELEKGDWKLTKVLSYDHQTKDTLIGERSIFGNDVDIEKWLLSNKIPALGLGIIKDGKLKQVKVFGELRNGVSAPYNTIFKVASLTKPISAMVALKLVDLGKWDLDEPLYKYWIDPDLKQDERYKKLTTRLVLSHQTGFPNWRYMSASNKLFFEFDPGVKYQYSGEGFEYLRKALEKKFHKSLDELADNLIFTPLKMRDTKFFWDKSVDESRFAVGHDKAGNEYPIEKYFSSNAAANLLTTVDDYGNFLVSVLNGAGLSPNVYKELIKYQVKKKENSFFGLGFEIYDLGNGEFALSHGGSDAGVNTVFFILPKTKDGLIIFTNVDDGWKSYERLLNHYLGKNGRRIVEIENQK